MNENIFKQLKDQGRIGVDTDGKFAKGGLVLSQEMTEEEYLEICKENKLKPTDVDLEKSEDEFDWAKTEGTISKDRVITIKGSDESVDRDGDIIRVAGWDLGNFKKNPVFLTHHNSRSMPVGRVVRVWKASGVEGSPSGSALMFRVFFPTAEVSAESDAVFKLYQSKLLNAVSVGFRVKKGTIPATDEERASMGLGKYGIEIKEAELHELSAVSIPANQNALVVRSLKEAELCKNADVEYEIETSEDEADAIANEAKDNVIGDDEGEDFVKVPKKVLDLLISKVQSTEEKIDKLLLKEVSSNTTSEDESQELNDESVDKAKDSESEATDDDLDDFATILKGFSAGAEEDDSNDDESSISELLLKSFNNKEES